MVAHRCRIGFELPPAREQKLLGCGTDRANDAKDEDCNNPRKGRCSPTMFHDVLNGREVVIEGSRFSRRVTLPRTHLESRSSSLSLTIHQVLELRRRTSPASAAAGNEVAMQIESL
jgi:hypothetical protein